MKGIGASQRVFEFVDRKPNVITASGNVQLPANIKGNIHFQNVSFRYPSRTDAVVFDGLNLEVSPNETLAVVCIWIEMKYH